MGSGVALLDFDRDGLLDIYLVNGAALGDPMPGAAQPKKSDPLYWNRLLRNRGNWRFEDVTEQAGVAGSGYGMGVTVGDYDNDGAPDIFITNFGPDTLLRNRGDGTFEDVSRNAGVRGAGWSSGAAFVDVDRDGLLDLFVAGYLEWSFADSRPCGDFLPQRRSYCHPRLFAPARHTLYRNTGDGFVDISSEAGLEDHRGKGLGVAIGYFDADDWIDILVANDSEPQQLFRNIEGRRFEETAVSAGVAYDPDGRTFAGMGIVWQDYDRDGRTDVLINALARQGYQLYRQSDGVFESASEASGIESLSLLSSGWGMSLADFDNDGWRDLVVGQGHVMDDIADSDPRLAHREPMLLARNLVGRFYDVTSRAGEAFQQDFAARGVAVGDLDGDGLLDVVVNVNDGQAFALRNTTAAAGRSLTVTLRGATDNRDGVGARVTVESVEGVRQHAVVSTAGSYLSSNGKALHFGVGAGECCKSVSVEWPNGEVQRLRDVSGSALEIRQQEAR